ncbi:hypothetical protein NIES37_42810 [Tolypothrix tenuis PCC 7101]|uniref:DUF732 domain-containing protein n=1 Tax=Tolypothrix tenuis PCC 7101 TaxID=231146 RepID=A0A1Z4N3R5_9CYAN|nr:DUF732 domain-containing protein [Aulosira sp. FACHB-113]BAY28757.1 hypothetical protein NIES2107_05890 [Nostoc carneum NIES-2107]BAZ00292.1 hypothetical protein NIES37_42810 [Tolypothrix tenuis PCC 7101]BAZ75787.1 hypothetical protein NIES50_43780 [Aulosira laxa NIES-50]
MNKLLVIPFVAIFSMVSSLPANAQYKSSSNDIFLQAVNNKLIDDGNPLSMIPNDKKIEHGISVCSALNSGSTVNEIAEYIIESLADSNLSQRDAKYIASYIATITGGGVAFYCPQYRQQILTPDS